MNALTFWRLWNIGRTSRCYMGEEKSEFLKGTLDMLILKVVALGPIHGYAIAQRIQRVAGSHGQGFPDRGLFLDSTTAGANLHACRTSVGFASRSESSSFA